MDKAGSCLTATHEASTRTDLSLALLRTVMSPTPSRSPLEWHIGIIPMKAASWSALLKRLMSSISERRDMPVSWPMPGTVIRFSRGFSNRSVLDNALTARNISSLWPLSASYCLTRKSRVCRP